MALQAYRLLIYVLWLPLLGWLWWRGKMEPAYRYFMKERLGYIDIPAENLGGILLHVASVGEAQGARQLIQDLLQNVPADRITISCQTPAGRATLDSCFGGQIRVIYFPIDTVGACARFLDRLQPRLVLLIEREIWPEMLAQCRNRVIPVALLSARLSARSARLYRNLAGLMNPIWGQLGLIAAADDKTAKRFQFLGVPQHKIVVAGNMKFDAPLIPPAENTTVSWPDFQGRMVVVAGSTHHPEETDILAAWPNFSRRHPNSILIIVPRHRQRFEAVAEQLEARGISFVRRSTGEAINADTAIFLGDTMGELPHWYRAADICFIGGSLAGVGGHNPLEALVYGKAVFFGPHTENFSALYADIKLLKIGQQAKDAHDLFELADQWIMDPERISHATKVALDFIRSNQGACGRNLDALAGFLAPFEFLQDIESISAQANAVWVDPACLTTAEAQAYLKLRSDGSLYPYGAGSGRGAIFRINHHSQSFLFRHYRRGGLVAKISRDGFLRTACGKSRAMREFMLLRELHARNLPTPKPVAAYYCKSLFTYRADIIVELIPDANNIVEILRIRFLEPLEYALLGRAIRQLHDCQVFHPDLNCHNLLIDGASTAWVVDFDKCGFRKGESWKKNNLDRLLRSFRKEAGNKTCIFHWEHENWNQLLGGYFSGQAPS